MSNKQKIFIIMGIIVIILISFIIGLFIGQRNAPKNDLAVRKVCGQTFYASIESIKQYSDGSFHINAKGLEVNDINYRGNFTFKVDDNMDITWRGESVKVADLKEGNNISITFIDEMIASISPTPLQEVVKIQILDDEIGKKKDEVNNKVTTIDIEKAFELEDSSNKVYTLNQEEIYEIFNIIDNLQFKKETCDGLPSYYIKYNSKAVNNFINYGVEILDNEYHITCADKG